MSQLSLAAQFVAEIEELNKPTRLTMLDLQVLGRLAAGYTTLADGQPIPNQIVTIKKEAVTRTKTIADLAERLAAEAQAAGFDPSPFLAVSDWQRGSHPYSALNSVVNNTMHHDPPELRSRYYRRDADFAAAHQLARRLALLESRTAHTSVLEPSTQSDPQIRRLQWFLDKMIRILETAPPEAALGSISNWEYEAAELVESIGLPDELGFPAQLRPVFNRTDADVDANGFPDTVVYSYTSPDGNWHVARFDWYFASAGESIARKVRANSTRPVASTLMPDADFIVDLLRCVKEWRDYTDAPRLAKGVAGPRCEEKSSGNLGAVEPTQSTPHPVLNTD